MKTPTAILLADTHIRETQPLCRTDDYFKAQREKWSFISDIQQKYYIPILIAGDLFDKWKPSPELLTWCIYNLPKHIRVIPGQHDLPNHNLELLHKSGMQTLESAGVIQIIRNSPFEIHSNGFNLNIHAYPFGSEPTPLNSTFKGSNSTRNIALMHYFTYKGTAWPGCKTLEAKSLLKRMAGFDLILCGDNHQSFIVEDNDRLLVNPGSLMRMKSDQIEHKPRLFLYYAEDNTVEAIDIPIEENVISRVHIDKSKDKDEKMEAFVDSVKNQGEIGLNFKENLETYFNTNEENDSVKNIVWGSMER